MRTRYTIPLCAAVAVTAFFVGEPSVAYGAPQQPTTTAAATVVGPIQPATTPRVRVEAWLGFDTPRQGFCTAVKWDYKKRAEVYCESGLERMIPLRPADPCDRKAQRNWFHTDYTTVTVKLNGLVHRGQQL